MTMAATSVSVSVSGITDIDAELWGAKWNTGKLTFSFPTSASFYHYPAGQEPDHAFQALGAVAQTAVRNALAAVSQVANLTFTEITETSSTQADVRFAMADLTFISDQSDVDA